MKKLFTILFLVTLQSSSCSVENVESTTAESPFPPSADTAFECELAAPATGSLRLRTTSLRTITIETSQKSFEFNVTEGKYVPGPTSRPNDDQRYELKSDAMKFDFGNSQMVHWLLPSGFDLGFPQDEKFICANVLVKDFALFRQYVGTATELKTTWFNNPNELPNHTAPGDNFRCKVQRSDLSDTATFYFGFAGSDWVNPVRSVFRKTSYLNSGAAAVTDGVDNDTNELKASGGELSEWRFGYPCVRF